MKNIFKKPLKFFKEDLWTEKFDNHFFYKWLRIFILSVSEFIKNKGFDKASTLTFYTLLTIIPLLAIGFGIGQALNFTDKLTENVKEIFKDQPQVADKLIEFSNATLKTTKGGIIASFGVILLFWTVIKTIGNMESFFNQIWEVKTSRTFLEQIKDYLPVILLFPIFLVGSSSVLFFMSTTTLAASKAVPIFSEYVGQAIVLGYQLLSYLLSWTLLSLLYIYLPNTHVSWKAGFTAGIITGIIFFIWQWIYVTFQVKASSYGVIYGSFAAVPLFLIWLNYSWTILIFGAEISYNVDHHMIKRSPSN